MMMIRIFIFYLVSVSYCIGQALQEDILLQNLRDSLKFTKLQSTHTKFYESTENWKDQLSLFIEKVMACPQWQIPGLSIGIVQNDQVVFQKGFGYRDLDKKEKVDENTLFGIGSCTKAFTTTLQAMLVDEGILDLDTPIIKQYLPNFRMMEDQVTLGITPRDTTCHRTGLPRHDLVWAFGTSHSTESLVYTLQYLNSNFKFRSKFEYNNLMFMTTGYIQERISGISWNNLIQKRIFDPLGMNKTNLNVSLSVKSGNYAFPYGISSISKKVVPFPPGINNFLDPIAPAGAINSNVKELANWLQFQLNSGKFRGKQLVSSKNLLETYLPTMAMPSINMIKPIFPVSFTSDSYGLGWMIGNYRGHSMIYHGGNTFGHSALVVLFPYDNIGISILTNMNGLANSNLLIAWYAFDLLNSYSLWLNGSTVCNFPCQFLKCNDKKEKEEEFKQNINTIKKDDYNGIYSHPTYGDISITQNTNFKWNTLSGKLISLDNDRFLLEASSAFFVDPVKLLIQFSRNFYNGNVDSLYAPLEPSLPPILFINSFFQPKTCGISEFVPK